MVRNCSLRTFSLIGKRQRGTTLPPSWLEAEDVSPGDLVGIVRDHESHRARILLADYDPSEVDLEMTVQELGASRGIGLPPEVEIVLGLSPEDTGAPLDVERESQTEISVAPIS